MKRTAYSRFLARAAVTLLAVFAFVGGAKAQDYFYEGFEGGAMPEGWTTDGPGTWSVGTGDYSASTGAGAGTYNAKITHGTTGNVTKLITPAIDLSAATTAQLSFMHIQRSWAGDIDKLKVYYRTSSEGEWVQLAEYTDAYASWKLEGDNGEIILPNLSSTYQIAFEMTDAYGYGVGIDEVTIFEGTSCSKPTAFAVSEIGPRSAVLSWTPGSEDQDAWQICINGDEENLIDVTENPYTLTGLTPETAYTVKVRTNCGGGDFSKWNNVTFTTAIAAPVPTNVVVSNVTKNSATVSWVSEATSFNVQYKATSAEEWQTTIATENSITITGLTPETEYQVQVQGNYGDLDGLSAWSAAVTFTTDVAFTAPTAVAANHVLATTAEISWTGNDEATSYNLRYAINTNFYEDFENGLGQWTVVRNGEGDGNTDWRVVNSNTIFSSGAIPAHSGNYVVMSRSYNGSGVNVDNWLISPQVNLGGTMTYWVRDDSRYHEHYDIYVSTTTTDLSAFAKVYEPGDASGEWTEVTVDLSAYAGQQGYVAFRNTDYDQDYLFIDDVTIAVQSNLEWTTVNDVTSPYTITGLSPETKYSVEVQAVYEGGESTWAPTSFTTLALDVVPFDLQTADVTATTATLNWDGAQDSYNVRYRKLVFFDDFENGLGNWTTYTMGDAPAWGAGAPISGLSGHNSSTNVAFSMSWNNNESYTADNWLVTPQVQLGGTLKFYVYTNQSYPDAYEVKLSTGGNTIDDFTVTLQEMASIPTTGDWVEVNIDLSSYEGQSGYIAIHHSFFDGNFIFVDDFSIYPPQEAGEWIEATSTTNSLDITGLTPGTIYEFQVQGNLTEGTTAWSTPAFFTTTTDIELANDATDNGTLIEACDGKVLNVTLSGRTLFKDGLWNTICLPFEVDLTDEDCPLYGDGVTAKTLTAASATTSESVQYGTHIDLTFGEAVTTLEAGKPYIIRWDNTGVNIEDPEFSNVTINATDDHTISMAGGDVQFIGYYNAFDITDADEDLFYMKSDGKLAHTGINRTLKACRAYFRFSEASSKLTFAIDYGDGEATGIVNLDSDTTANSGWYTVDGKKLDNEPTRKGVYIQDGRKVVIK